MAAARQCDICGNTYPMYNTKRDKDKTNGIVLVNIDEQGQYWTNPKMDCCPECMESIKAHINMLKQKGENKHEKEMEEHS